MAEEKEKANEEELTSLQILGIVLLIVLSISSLLELGLFVTAFIYADKVECNLLWCTFTSGDVVQIKHTQSITTISQDSSSQCFVNQKETNCSEIDKELEKLR